MISKDKTMRSASRYPGAPPTGYAVEWRRRIPSHELMVLGVPELVDFPSKKNDRRTEPGRLFWQS
jgi:hypothetical protein